MCIASELNKKTYFQYHIHSYATACFYTDCIMLLSLYIYLAIDSMIRTFQFVVYADNVETIQDNTV